MKKVSAETITDLTAAAATVPGAGGTPPGVEEMIRQIRDKLTARADALSASEQHAQDIAPPAEDDGKGKKTAFGISHARALENLEQFEKIIKDVPNGFLLVPVLYSTIRQNQNTKIYSQFNSYVRPRFLRFLAKNHAEELKALGIGEKGIRRMSKGHSPVDNSGRPYDVNVDHIIERFGGGTASLTQEIDTHMPAGSKPTHLTNHFNNLMLMPRAVHDMKNKLNELQNAADTPSGDSRWILMLVPKADALHAGYVSQSQPDRLPARDDSAHRISAVKITVDAAARLGQIIDGYSNEDAHKSNAAAALKDVAAQLKTAFNASAKRPQEFSSFHEFYKGKRFSALRAKLAILPDDKTLELRRTLQWMDKELSCRFNDAAVNPHEEKKISSPKKRPRRKRRKPRKHRKNPRPGDRF